MAGGAGAGVRSVRLGSQPGGTRNDPGFHATFLVSQDGTVERGDHRAGAS